MKVSQKKGKKTKATMFTRWMRNPNTGEIESIKVTAKVVGKNTYYFQGKKQITDKLFHSEEEALQYWIVVMDAQVFEDTSKLLAKTKYRNFLQIRFLGLEDRARENNRA